MLKKILIKTKRQVFSEIAGNNASIFKGEGFDFVELREYGVGDDIRNIDWKTTAKKQKPYVKIFKEERELNIVIAPFLSANMLFGKNRSKQTLIAEITALLSFSSLKNGDRFSLVSLNKEVDDYTKPSKKLSGVSHVVSKVINTPLTDITHQHNTAILSLYKHLKKRSIIFLIGDFFEKIDLIKLSKKHEVVVLIVRDTLEENLFESDFINLLDPEAKHTMQGSISKKDIIDYQAKITENDHNLYAHFKKNAVRFVKIYTDDEPYTKLQRLFI